MADFWENHAEEILITLDEQGHLFPPLRLNRQGQGLKLLGRGGFSCVYEMADPANPDRSCALKVSGFRAQTIGSKAFRSASRIQWGLSQESPYIVKILYFQELLVATDDNGAVTDVKKVTKELTEEPAGYRYLQMVFMEKLESVLERTRKDRSEPAGKKHNAEKEALKFAAEIGLALESAHVREYLHRDVKLENVFWDPTEKVYKLGDFGIARRMEAGSAGTIVFSDGYGAPEILRMHDAHYDAKAEIYSLGICLYLLLNDLKFPGSDNYYPKTEIQYQENFVFPAPRYASAGMTNLIRRMCSFYAKDRYRSMEEVLMALAGLEEPEEDEELSALMETVMETVQYETETATAANADATTAYTENREAAEDEAEKPGSRAEAKKKERLYDLCYREDTIKYVLILTPLVTLLLHAIQPFAQMPAGWIWYLAPVVLLFETLLQRLKEMHVLFGMLILGGIVFSVISHGFFFAHILWILCILIGCPALTAVGALSSGLWILLAQTEKLRFLDRLHQWDLGWILLVAVMLVAYLYFDVRRLWGKTTYLRAWLAVKIYDVMFLAMALAGIVLWILQKASVIELPELLTRMHLIRTGVAGFAGFVFLAWKSGVLEEEAE